jgi:hypothetical protein
MTPAEVAYRVLRAVQARAESARRGASRGVPEPDLARFGAPWIDTRARVDARPLVAAAERIAQGRLDVFALRAVDLGSPPRWNRDPKTGIEAPLVYGKLLDYRDQDLVGDIKYLWEPNRHLHLVTLAQAYALTGRKAYLQALEEHLDTWFIACPPGYGANWASALEVALRLVNWSAAWQILGGAQGGCFSQKQNWDFRARWLRSVWQHADFISRWFSLHSSANNHLIGEAAGLFIAGLTWPHWKEAKDWVASSKKILEEEILKQNAPDGVNREQAVWYQQFVLEMLVLCLLAGKANGQWFSPDYESRIEAMMDFIASIMDCGGNVPMFGDADDGVVLELSQEAGFSPFRSALATGAMLFRRGDFKLKAGRLDDRTRWLFGAGATSRRRRRSAPWSTPGRSATARSRRTATPTRSPSRSRSAAASSSSIRAPTPITRNRAGATTSAAPARTTRCASTGSTSRCPAATSCGRATRARPAACGSPRPTRIRSRAGTTATRGWKTR